MQDKAFANSNVMEFIDLCTNKVPGQYKFSPWKYPELVSGTALLSTEDGMNCYIAAYGEMHYVKCLTAMQNFPYEAIKGNIEIVDWGCGQGIGSLTIMECLQNHKVIENLLKVTLIEPSSHTLGRAESLVREIGGSKIGINAINKYLPTVAASNVEKIESLSYQCDNIIHIFSNILDVADFDFAKIAEIAVDQGKNAYFVCVGPMNYYSYRIDQFCSVFDSPTYFSTIDEKAFRRTSSTFHLYGCKTRCFSVSGPIIIADNCNTFVKPTLIGDTPIIDDYDSRYAVECGLISERMQELGEIIGKVIAPEDIFILKPQINGDSVDALVVSRNKGILLLNLWEKDLNDYQFASTTDNNGINIIDYLSLQKKDDETRTKEPTPLAVMDAIQRNLATHHLSDLLDIVAKDYKQIDVIKKVIVFTKNTTDEVRRFFINHWNYNTLFGFDLYSDNYKQTNFISLCYFDKTNQVFDDLLMHRFLHMLSPKWHSYKEGKNVNLTTVQKHLSESRQGARQKISGVAGSGKTQVLCQRAVNAQKRTGGNILVLSYNITLANYLYYRLDEICADFPWEKFRISHYHEFFKEEANNCGLHAGLTSYDDGHFFDKHVSDLPKYDAIFIDEVQDYKPEWLSNIFKFLKSNAELVVFGDPSQNIFNRERDQYGDINLGAAIGGYWNKDLKKTKRITNPRITELANAFKKEMMNEQVLIETSQERELPFELQYEYQEEIPSSEALVGKICDVITEMDFELKDTVILAQKQSILCDTDYYYRKATNNDTSITFASREEIDYLREVHKIVDGGHVSFQFSQDLRAKDRNKKLAFSMDSRFLKFSTIHSFKGWEANNVILILLPLGIENQETKYTVSEQQNLPALIYTGITRAKENFYILNFGNKEYKEFFENNMNVL